MSYCRFRVMADSTPTLKQRLAGRSLYLVGMMGSGKTSTGRPLAERLRYGFVDADACLLYTSPSPRDISGSRMPSSA